MFSQLKPIQLEMLVLFKSRIIKNSNTAVITKSEIQNYFKDIPISVVNHYIDDLITCNLICVDWKPSLSSKNAIQIEINPKVLEYM